MTGPRIAVVGSLHMDLIASADRLPGAGESVNGTGFVMAPGGKGGNQAAQCARLGAETFIVTQLGDDLFGHQLKVAMDQRGIRTDFLSLSAKHATGASTVFASGGDYSSIIYPGAAAALLPDDITRCMASLAPLDAVLLQLELPMELSRAAAEAARKQNAFTVLNASPAPVSSRDIPRKLLDSCDLLIVNRTEAARLTARDAEEMEPAWAARELAKLGPRQVIITLGAQGAVAWDGKQSHVQKAFAISLADAVGAGDAFLGSAVMTLLDGRNIAEALRRGAAAGAFAASHQGASAMPDRAQIEDFLNSRSFS